ncbi:MAG TPA: ornithine cyclodeaminase family protein [Thermoflexales bacterium]|nr:ornithine cyclodeaminase family protein [Thermoflexales bacterium]HQX09489.1 ornithine cyclodeaminase family protein [Thermoflexales bacterium]
MDTIVLTRSQIVPLLDPDAILPALARGFVAYSAERRIPAQRVRSPLPGATSAMLLFPGLAPEIQAYTVTVQSKNPAQNPTSGGIIALHDLPTGALLAVLDAGYLTAVRTGFSGALGAHTLARPEAGDVAVIGAGNQGGFLLRGLARLRPIKRVFVYDVNPAQASLYAKRAEDDLGVPIIVSDSVASAVGDADIIFTATWAREAFLFSNLIQPGAHITTIGPDEPGKCEVSAELLRHSVFVCDDRDLAASMGAIAGAGLSIRQVHAELGDVLAGRATGRSSPGEITVYGAVGLAFQDLVVAWQVYHAAQLTGAGTRIGFND